MLQKSLLNIKWIFMCLRNCLKLLDKLRHIIFLFKIMEHSALQSPNLLSSTLSGTDWMWGTREPCVQKRFGNCTVPHNVGYYHSPVKSENNIISLLLRESCWGSCSPASSLNGWGHRLRPRGKELRVGQSQWLIQGQNLKPQHRALFLPYVILCFKTLTVFQCWECHAI